MYGLALTSDVPMASKSNWRMFLLRNYKHWPVLASGGPGAMWNTGPAPGPTQDTPDSARVFRRPVWVGYFVHFGTKM